MGKFDQVEGLKGICFGEVLVELFGQVVQIYLDFGLDKTRAQISDLGCCYCCYLQSLEFGGQLGPSFQSWEFVFIVELRLYIGDLLLQLHWSISCFLSQEGVELEETELFEGAEEDALGLVTRLSLPEVFLGRE